MPGRKTDVGDVPWLAELLAHGLVRASFVPKAETWVLRSRKQFVREAAAHTRRLRKTIEDANIKLDAVRANLLGASGRAMLEALAEGGTDPATLAALAHPWLAATPERLEEALQGWAAPHHRFLLRLHLDQVDAGLAPFRAAVELLTPIPGVGALIAQVIVSEIGLEMGRFPTAGHPLSRAGMCPRDDESAGKRRSARLREGAPWLETTLARCAWAASRKKASYLQAQSHRLRGRRGPKEAICAAAASILAAAYHTLEDAAPPTSVMRSRSSRSLHDGDGLFLETGGHPLG